MFALQLLIVWTGGLWKVTSISIFKKKTRISSTSSSTRKNKHEIGVNGTIESILKMNCPRALNPLKLHFISLNVFILSAYIK